MDAPPIREAFGEPGIEPRWTHGGKDGVGTAYAASSRIWFTLWNGIITEVYYPTVDRPQLRDLQFLITDGKSFFHEEKRHLASKSERLSLHALGYRCTNSDTAGRYTITKTVIADPDYGCVLQRMHLTGDKTFISDLRLYALCAPHLDVGGAGNTGYVMRIEGRKILMAHKGNIWLAMAATVPFSRVSCGYVGRSDGWTDISGNFQMDWEFDRAPDGNIALTGELPGPHDFTLGLAFGQSEHQAITTLIESLSVPFEKQYKRFNENWERQAANAHPLDGHSGDGGRLYRASLSLIRAHEDKSYPGAFIASLSIPWGAAKGDRDRGGYHLVWTRDLVNSATGKLAGGDDKAPLRALIYLATSQQEDGGFAQNFWIDGRPYWQGIQLDEVAFPVLLASHLERSGILLDFDPWPMVMRAAAYLVRHGPVTQQERWEEVSGYSPSTLAANIAALICAAAFARKRGDEATARFLEQYADFLECHLEDWTVTTQGTLLPDVKRHYIRILPATVDNPEPEEDPNRGMLMVKNQPPGKRNRFPAKEIVDAGFLELVRYGIRPPDDPAIVDSLRVVDSVLKVDTPWGPCWRRFNHDGYGQREDGGAYIAWGKGRAWPLLTGERGHYELAAGHDAKPFITAMEGFAHGDLLTEQIWDGPDRPDIHMWLGRPTGAAMPLMWPHSEYIKLLRSSADGRVFDLIPDVADRYCKDRADCQLFEVWKHNRRVKAVKRGYILRIQMLAPFRLHWSGDEWRTFTDTASVCTCLDVEFADIPIGHSQHAPIRFTFFWPESGNWEGHDYAVSVE